MPGAPFDKYDYAPLTTFNFEQVTVAGSSVGLTAATLQTAIRAVITVQDAQIRLRYDGATTAPTSTVGHPYNPGDEITIWGQDIGTVRFIRTGGVSATLNVSYGR